MLRLVLSFAILHIIVVVRISTVVVRIIIIVPKRRDESPHNLFLLLLLSLSSLSKTSRAHAKKKTKKKRNNFLRTIFDEKTRAADIKLEKKVLTFLIDDLHAKRERRERQFFFLNHSFRVYFFSSAETL